MYPSYVSKDNSNREKQREKIISNREKLYEAKSEGRLQYLAIKKLSPLLRGITSINIMEIFIV